MFDPVALRFFGVPGLVVLWLLALVSFSLFGARVFRYVNTLRRARPENRWHNLPRRIGLFIVNVLGQRRMFDEWVIGVAHFLIFWAFVFYAAGFLWSLVRGLFPFLPIPYADEVGWMALALVAFGILGLVALAVAAVRRYLFTPQGLELSGDATLILGLIAMVLVTSLVGHGTRESAPRVARAMWWLHMAIVLGFMAYLPYSKHLHLLASPFGVLFGALQPGGVPPASEGAARREEFTWRELFNGLACAECGRCERACPAFQSGEPLSPKVLMHHFKELVRAPGDGGNGKSFVGDVVSRPEIWACRACLACMDRCPVFNEHIPALVEMRRHLVLQGDMDAQLQSALTNLARYGNSFGTSPRARARWTRELDFAIRDARKEPVDYLWFVGDYASFDPRLQPVTRAAARVFQAAGLDFGILHEGEQNSGNDVRRVGEEGLGEMLADKNRQAFGAAQFQRLVTTDPHSFQALRHEYGTAGEAHGAPRPVRHHTEVVDQLMAEGRLPVGTPLTLKATYHDPCYLGRYNRIYDAPRRILRRIGVDLAEMPRTRASSYCCGAGGGKIWMEDVPAKGERPAESRVKEAAAIPGVSTLVVSCPKDLVMFLDALKTTGLEGRLAVKEMMELVEEACIPHKE
jgi:Fe-S oxidoreductase